VSRLARFFWICAASATLCFVALLVLSKGSLEPQGLVVFDSHLMGYDLAFAPAYLAAMTEAQIAQYLGVFRILDTIFPGLLAISLAGALWLNAKGLHPFVRFLLLFAPAIYLMMDLAENASVAQMLRAGVTVQREIVEQASAFSVAKWAALSGTVLLTLWAWWRAPRTPTRRPG